MPSTWSRNLRLERIATGEQPGTWGISTNNNLDLIDDAIDGLAEIQLTSASYKVDTINGGASEGRSKVLHFTGTLTAPCRVTISPLDAEKIYIVINATNGTGGPGTPGQDIIFQQGAGATYTLASGYANLIYCDGLGDTSGVFAALKNLQVNNLKIDGAIAAAAGMNVTGNVGVTGNLTVTGTLSAGASTLASLTVTGATTAAAITASGAVTCSSSLSVAGALTTTGTVQLDLASSAAGDIFYRSSTGPLARLGIGAAGQYLRATAGAPAWQTVDTSITMGVTPVSASANGRVHYTFNGVMSSSDNFKFNPANGAAGCAGTFSAGGSISSDAAITAVGAISSGGDMTAGSGTLYLTNAGGLPSTLMYLQAFQDNLSLVKSAGGGAISIKNAGFEMIRCNGTSHLQLYIAGYSKALIDGMLTDNTGIICYDGVAGQLVIRYKVPGVGPVNFRIASSGPQ